MNEPFFVANNINHVDNSPLRGLSPARTSPRNNTDFSNSESTISSGDYQNGLNCSTGDVMTTNCDILRPANKFNKDVYDTKPFGHLQRPTGLGVKRSAPGDQNVSFQRKFSKVNYRENSSGCKNESKSSEHESQSTSRRSPASDNNDSPPTTSAAECLRLKIKRKQAGISRSNDDNSPDETGTADKKLTLLTGCSVRAAKNSAASHHHRHHHGRHRNGNYSRKLLRSLSNETNPRVFSVKKQVDFDLEKYRDVGTWVRTVGGLTESDCLGPCEPGTSITLEGIVWSETSSGILVVNVTWRGKSYVGTLLDCSKSEWSAPRFCESPSVNENEFLTVKNSSGAKGRHFKKSGNVTNSSITGGHMLSNNASSPNLASLSKSVSTVDFSPSSAKKLRPPVADEPHSTGSSVDFSSSAAPSSALLETSSPVLLQCPTPSCHRKYDNLVALTYHQNSSHRAFCRCRTDASTSTGTHPPTNDVSVNVDAASFPPVSPKSDQLSVQAKKCLSELEHASLESLFNVVGRTSKDAPTAAPDLGPPKTTPLGSVILSPLVTSSSSEQIWDLTKPVEPGGDQSANVLVDERPPSLGFSDVSDAEEAPTLERNATPLAVEPLGRTEFSIAASVDRTNDKPTSTNQNATEKTVKNHAQTLAPGLIKTEPLSNASALPAQQPIIPTGAAPSPLDRPSPHKLPMSNFPSAPFAPGFGPYSTGAAGSLLSSHHPLLSYDQSSAIPLLFGPPTAAIYPPFGVPPPMGPMPPGPMPYFIPPPPSSGPPLHLAQLTGPPGGLCFGSPAGAAPLLPSPQQQHKIHQLTDKTGGPPSARQVAQASAMATTKRDAPLQGGGVGKNVNSPPSSAQRDSSNKTSVDGDARSPPIQRHHHLHHHTHSYPGLIQADPYAVMASQQAAAAAAAGLVGTAAPAYPFVTK